MKRVSSRMSSFICCLLLACTLFLTGCGGQGTSGSAGGSGAGQEAKAAEAKAAGNSLTVKVLDVGQGDAILIQTGSQTILVDTGDDKYYEDGKKGKVNNQLFEELQKANVTAIDKLVLTHAHADHIGKAAQVIEKYGVKELVYNGIPSTNKYFVNALKAAKAQGTKQVKVKAGDVLDFGSGVTYEVFSPTAQQIKDDTAAIKAGEKPEINDQSVVGRLSFGSFAMLLTGDAESPVEKQMAASYGSKLQCQILKSGHHGSKSSSSKELLQAVKPEAVVISAGANNQYGHPHDVTLNKYKKQGIKQIYRTDQNGTVTIVSDGKGYSVSCGK